MYQSPLFSLYIIHRSILQSRDFPTLLIAKDDQGTVHVEISRSRLEGEEMMDLDVDFGCGGARSRGRTTGDGVGKSARG